MSGLACIVGHDGLVCGGCDDMYTRDLGQEECVHCDDVGPDWLFLSRSDQPQKGGPEIVIKHTENTKKANRKRNIGIEIVNI